jgi:8-oxo-dGTP pyrophosphatase MutT (NUDIX family)
MPSEDRPSKRRGAVGVIVQRGKLLVIERAATVRAPGKLCFPGGAIEAGESEQVALVRELSEEINVRARPVRRVWFSRAGVDLELYWWLAELSFGQRPSPNPAEVASLFWMTPAEMAVHPELLPTNRLFLEALRVGEIRLE